ncbi:MULTISPECIES: hypothetical protein [unclassified Gordonia (in: high G+C Gram-positive bacteria)]|uniref:hypothetical protein n=1 Tax=Gordonia sp. VNQ95 TaxID=3156619 RepID=UPI0032B31F2B
MTHTITRGTALLAAVLLMSFLGSPPHAAAQPPDPVTITLTSDTEINEQLLWYDSAGRPRHQFDVPLTDVDEDSGHHVATLTYIPNDAETIVRVVFVSGGEYAACAITRGDATVAEDTAQGDRAMAVCE